MDDLIEALTILRTYGNPTSPTNCFHDLLVFCVDPAVVSDEDIDRLADLEVGFDEHEDCFHSHRFGSA